MRAFKTPEKDRTTYRYHTVTGEKIELTPEAVGDAWIAKLHAEDDAEIDAARRDQRLTPMHYDSLWAMDKDFFNSPIVLEAISNLTDTDPDPLERMIKAFEAQEHEALAGRLRDALQELQPQQRALIYKTFYERRTNVSIAAEEGVTEAAIRNRLKKIYARLIKKLTVVSAG